MIMRAADFVRSNSNVIPSEVSEFVLSVSEQNAGEVLTPSRSATDVMRELSIRIPSIEQAGQNALFARELLKQLHNHELQEVLCWHVRRGDRIAAIYADAECLEYIGAMLWTAPNWEFE